jgi:hypothetical protein
MLWLALALLAVGSGVTGARTAAEISCPAELVVTERVAPAQGWSVRSGEKRRPLSGIGFFSGPPEQMAALVNDEEQPGADGSVAIWHFPPAKERYWVACYYRGTATTLARQLPAAVKTCRVSYAKPPEGSSALEPKSMTCE